MTGKRSVIWFLAGLISLLLVAVAPAAAQSSFNEELISGLNLKLLYVAIPIAILVELILFTAVWRFRESNVDEPKPTQENRRLEITWTVATAVILAFVGFAAYQVLGVAAVGGVNAATVDDPGEAAVGYHDGQGAVGPPQGSDAVEVEVVAQKYYWTFNYRNLHAAGNESQFVSQSSLQGQPMVVPANTEVYLHITSIDWLHAFHAPDLALKQDAFPGRYNTIKLVDAAPGSYQLYCAEYCGVGHSQMLGTIKVLPRAENPEDPAEGTWEHWVAQQKASLGNESN